jgi:potassium-transporting ATPase KdpC subunit
MKELRQALLVFIVLSLVTGLGYPLAISGLCHYFALRNANGSLVSVRGKLAGSELIGQRFSSPHYFHGRPSANDYDASNSGGSNLGPANEKYLGEVAARINRIRSENRLSPEASVPADLVLASGSGLDPDISIEGAILQVPRIVETRGLSEKKVMNIVQAMAERPYPKGQRRVNVLKLNLALDRQK